MDKCNINDCEIYPVLKKLNSRWLPFILIELKNGAARFTDLHERFEYLTATQLTRSLKKGIEYNYLVRENDRYQLTELGQDIVSLVIKLEEIEEKYYG